MNFCWITWHNVPEDSSLHSLCCENLKSGKEIRCLFMTSVAAGLIETVADIELNIDSDILEAE
jgi:hypothetical protein